MPRSARDLGEDGFGFGGEAWLGLDGLAGDGDRDALEGSKCLHWAGGWIPDRLIFMFQAALLVSYQSRSASFGVRYWSAECSRF